MPKILNLLRLRSFASAGDSAAEVSTINDTQPRLRIDAGGKLTWGSGTASGDTTLYRDSANVLKTDDALVAAGGLTVKTIEIDPAGAVSGNALVFNGTKFAPGEGGGGASITISDTAPVSPTAGDLWFESDTAKTFVYYDSAWVEIGGGGGGGGGTSLVISDTAPVSPDEGTLWFNSSTGRTYVYYDSTWVEIGAVASLAPGEFMRDSQAGSLITMEMM